MLSRSWPILRNRSHADRNQNKIIYVRRGIQTPSTKPQRNSFIRPPILTHWQRNFVFEYPYLTRTKTCCWLKWEFPKITLVCWDVRINQCVIQFLHQNEIKNITYCLLCNIKKKYMTWCEFQSWLKFACRETKSLCKNYGRLGRLNIMSFGGLGTTLLKCVNNALRLKTGHPRTKGWPSGVPECASAQFFWQSASEL
jgi:hypothetical protein